MPVTNDTEAVDTLLQRLIDWHTPSRPPRDAELRADVAARGRSAETTNDRS